MGKWEENSLTSTIQAINNAESFYFKEAGSHICVIKTDQVESVPV